MKNVFLKNLNIFKEIPKPIQKLNWVVFVYYLGWGIVFPFLGIYLKERLENYTSAATVMSLLYFFSVPWALFLGEKEDQIPKKNILNFTLLLYLPFSFIFLSLKTLGHFLILRAFHSGMSTSFWATSEAYVRKYSPKDKATLCISSFNAFMYLSLVIGGIASGFLFKKFSFNIIYAISIFAFLAAILATFLHNNEKTYKKKITIEKEIEDFLKNKKLVKTTLIFAITMMIVAILDFTLPFVIKNLKGNPVQIGFVYALFYIPLFSQIFFAFPKNKKRLFFFSVFLALTTFLAMFLIPTIPIILAGSLIIGLAVASIIPIISGKITIYLNKDKIGEQNAVVYAIKNLAMGIGYLGAGIIADLSQIQNVFIFGALIVALILFKSIKAGEF